MNKIYEAFDSIKVDSQLKEKVYSKIEQKAIRPKFTFNRSVMIRSLAMASIFIIITVGIYFDSYNNNFDNDKGIDKNFIKNQEYIMESDSIFYDGNTYVRDTDIITKDMLDKELGKLIQTNKASQEKDSTIEVNSHYHNGAAVYSVKDFNNYEKLAILNNGEIFLYKKVYE